MRSETAAPPPFREPAASGGLLAAFTFLAAVGLAAFCGAMLAIGEVQAMFVALTLIGALLVLYDFRIGVVLLIVALPFSNSRVFPHELLGIRGLNPMNLLTLATLASFVLHGGLARLRGLLPLPLVLVFLPPILLAAYLGLDRIDEVSPAVYDVMLVHSLTAFNYLNGALVRPMLIVVVAMLLAAAVAQSEKPERFIGALIAALWGFCLITIGYVLLSGIGLAELARADARGFFSDPLGLHANELGRYFLMGYALTLFMWWETKRPGLKTLLAVTLGVVTLAILLTFSRAAFLGYLLVSGMFLLWKFNARTLSLLLIASVLGIAFMPEALYQRITFGMDSGDIDEVSAGRVAGLWLPLLPDAMQAPPWGHGAGSILWSNAMLTEAIPVTSHPHNAYLRALLDMGVIGLTLMLVYYATVWRGFRSLAGNAYLSREMRGFFQGACAGLAAFFLTHWFGSDFVPVRDWVLLWMAIGMMYGMLARRPAR